MRIGERIRSWRWREALLLLLALVLTGFIGYLVLANHRAAIRQRQEFEDRIRGDAELHAQSLSHFLGARLGMVQDLASAPELVAYFENRALGMSAEYGLRQTLQGIAERFDSVRRGKLLDGRPVFERLRFHVQGQGILASSPAEAATAAAMPSAGISVSSDRSHLRLVAPVVFRGAEGGRAEAVIAMPLLCRMLGAMPPEEHAGILIADRGDMAVLVAHGGVQAIPPSAVTGLIAGGGRFLASSDDRDHRTLVVGAPIAQSPLVVVMVQRRDRVLGDQPWHGLLLMLLLSVTLLGGAVALVVNMVHGRRLGERVAELQIQGEIESARSRETLSREISARKQAEVERAQLGYALEQAAESIMITDASGIILYVNPAFTSTRGWEREEVLGRKPGVFKSLVHDQDFYRGIWGELLAGRSWRGRFVNRCKDGRLIQEDATISPVRDASGEIVRFVAVMRDVTEVIRMQEQLRQAQKLESVGHLAAGIAHEINTPIQFIGDNLRFISKGVDDVRGAAAMLQALAAGAGDGAEARRQLEAADLPYLMEELPRAVAQSLEGVERVAVIVRSMKDFSHPGESGIAPADFNRCIESTVTISRSEWKYVALVDMDLDPHLPPVPMAVADFNQAVLNLIVNAAHAIAERRRRENRQELGRIAISTGVSEGMAELRVRDDGCGIPEAIRSRIFEPFFTTKEVGKGTGQGLAITRSAIVNRMHGDLRFESAEGVGTVFILRLPLTQGRPPTDAGLQAAPVPATASPG